MLRALTIHLRISISLSFILVNTCQHELPDIEIKPSVCGNHVIETGEDCEDGNTVNNDGCSAACQQEEGWYCNTENSELSICETQCGDKIVAGNEQCEDDNANNNDSCPDGINGTCRFAVCGDGFVRSDSEIESCDDGTDNGSYGYCNTTCDGLGPHCGDGDLNGDEDCDEGISNGANGHCNTTCDDYVPAHAPQGISFVDLDQDSNQLQGDIIVTKAIDESDLDAYAVYWGSGATQKLAGQPVITVLDKTGANHTITISENTLIPVGASHLLAYSRKGDGEMTSGVSIEIVDVAVPVHAARIITFDDQDLTKGEIQGDISITAASDESDVDFYTVYWAQDATTKVDSVPAIDTHIANGSNFITTLPQNTIPPTQATHLLVLTSNSDGEMKSGIATAIYDRAAPVHAALGITFTDTDPDNNEIAGNLIIQMASDESDITHYVLYWGETPTTKLSGYQALATIAVTGSNLIHTFPQNSGLPANADYFLVCTRNNDGEMGTCTNEAITDVFLPAYVATGITFSDHDGDQDQLQGTVTIYPATNETNITEYRLYWGENEATKHTTETMITSFTADGGSHTYEFSANTAVPNLATHLLVYSYYLGAETDPPTVLDIPDRVIELVADMNTDFDVSESSYPQYFASYQGNLLFQAETGFLGKQLYSYNGTDKPVQIPDEDNSYNLDPRKSIVFNNTFFFSGQSSSTGRELLVYDGINPPFVLEDINHSTASSNPDQFTIYNNDLYFSAYNGLQSSGGNGIELWVYRDDGSSPDPDMVYDGNTEGAGHHSPQYMTYFNGGFCYRGYTSDAGDELWCFDGSSAYLAADIDPTGSSYPGYFIVFNNELCFMALEGTSNPPLTHGQELFCYDGTNSYLVYDINPTGDASPSQFVEYKGNLIMKANDGTHGNEIWSWNGIDDPVMLLDISESGNGVYGPFVEYNDILYFQAYHDVSGSELWAYDGEQQPYLVKDIHTTGSANPSYLTNIGNELIFAANDGFSGTEVWVLDSLGEPIMIKDINPGLPGSTPAGFFFHNNKVYFQAYEDTHGIELWVYYIK